MLLTNEVFLNFMRETPALYAPGAPLWEDEHISRGMLAAHLNPESDAASRRHAFIDQSALWIAARCGGGALLDLGCGPGLYASRLAKRGLSVTGVDLSPRSIAYARERARAEGLDIDYRCRNYLELDADGAFDMAILVYCDFGVLSPEDRARLLERVFRALRPGGMLLLDAWGAAYANDYEEGERVFFAASGFWSPVPHAAVERRMRYRETDNTLERYLIVTADECKTYHTWNQIFTRERLAAELSRAGFDVDALFDDVSGAPYTGRARTLCALARRS